MVGWEQFDMCRWGCKNSRWWMVVVALCGVAAGRGNAQDSVSSSLVLPTFRVAGAGPSVSTVGTFATVSGQSVSGPITASLAVEDLYEYAGQLRMLFPWSAAVYPADSIRRAQVERAAAWWTRLQALGGAAISGRQRIPLAMVAFHAEHEALAAQLFDTLVSELATRPAERALVLASAVATFADRDQDSVRFARNFPVAMAYARRLMALPAGGYPSRRDSLDIARQQFEALFTLSYAVDALRPSDGLLAQVDPLLALIATRPHDERVRVIQKVFPYASIATEMVAAPDGHARLDSLSARLTRLVVRRDAEWPPQSTAADRAAMRARDEQAIRETVAPFALIGQPAPPVAAHAWLNTPDSLYASTPRAHPLNDGVVRVMTFSTWVDGKLAAFDRIQRHAPAGVQVVVMTETTGAAGPDLVSPADEVAWLRTFFCAMRHFTFTVALWAGEKVAQETPLPPVSVPAGDMPSSGTVVVADARDGTLTPITSLSVTVNYQRLLPAPSPSGPAYRFATHLNDCIVVDGHGIIRSYFNLNTHEDEARLLRLLSALRDHAAPAS